TTSEEGAMRYVKWTFLILVVAIVAAFLHYTLPRTDIVRITGTDVVRVDTDGLNGLFYAGADAGNATQASRDVRFVNAVNENRNARVYRNQDTGWGWPPYFKFDSANLQAEANDYDSDVAQEWVAVRHYGWRLEFLSIYPNALSLRGVEGPDATVIPWTTLVALLMLLAIGWAITVRVIRFRRTRIDPMVEDMGDAVVSKRRRIRNWFAGR
ncbi:MAG: DUF1523 family protein, partial [Pseudomonadota bacterium]